MTKKPLSSAFATPRAQLSIVEHALCPLDSRVSLKPGFIFKTGYTYSDPHRNRRRAKVRVGCVDGLSSTDELYLWGLIGLALSQKDASPDFFATPYWILRQLGRVSSTKKGSSAFELFRASIRRLAGVRYENSAFYDPIRSEHRQVSFGFLNYSLPANNDSARAWRFAWDPIFWELCQANRGSLKFDMELYSELSPAARRMYLLLKKLFWRNPATSELDVRQLAVDVLGFSDSIPMFKIREKMERVVLELLEAEIVVLDAAQKSLKDCFSKRGTGDYRLKLSRGSAFDRAGELGSGKPEDSPLYDPLAAIGFDRSAIVRLLKAYKPKLLQTWADITLAAVDKGRIEQSPQAFFTYYIKRAAKKEATPPDWWLEYERNQRRAEDEQQRAKAGVMPETSPETFESYMATEARDVFESVMQRLLKDLVGKGRTNREAEELARQHATIHVQNKYRQKQKEQGIAGF